jgi:hypothetical protein
MPPRPPAVIRCRRPLGDATGARRHCHGGACRRTFVASAAYVDPGNFATKVRAGAQHGYLRLRLVL